jgi:hypothetical protein
VSGATPRGLDGLGCRVRGEDYTDIKWLKNLVMVKDDDKVESRSIPKIPSYNHFMKGQKSRLELLFVIDASVMNVRLTPSPFTSPSYPLHLPLVKPQSYAQADHSPGPLT